MNVTSLDAPMPPSSMSVLPPPLPKKLVNDTPPKTLPTSHPLICTPPINLKGKRCGRISES